MTASLPDIQAVDINAEPTSLAQRWKKWTSRVQNLVTALYIKDPERRNHYVRQDVHGNP